MENIFIFKELKTEFSKYVDENNQISDVKAQRASWKFGIYPSTSQIFEIHQCRSEDNCLHNLEFHEYCLLISTIKNDVDKSDGETKFKITRTNTINNNKPLCDVFLGGACNPTTWRFDVAIPFLKEKNITFYNPQVSQWDPSLIEKEERAKLTAKVQLFVLDIYRTRGIASLVEAAYLSGQGRNLILVVPAERPVTMKEVEVKELDENEFQSINRSYLFIADLVQRQGIPLFTSVSDALKATRISLISNLMIQDLTEIDGVVPVKHAYVNVSTTVRALQKTFCELDSSRSGVITQNDVKRGLRLLFGCDVNPISVTKDVFTFPDLCIEYSILLLLSILRYQEQTRSHSVVSINTRSSSLDNISIPGNIDTRKSNQDVKNRLSSHEDDPCKLPLEKNSHKKKKSSHQHKNSGIYITRLMKWPFSKISMVTGDSRNSPNNDITIKLVPQQLVDEEKYDIFLGGTCGDSNWRENIAIPLLSRVGCTYYDPQVSNSMWSRRMLPREARAREQSKILVYVITNECTSTAAMVEAAHFIGQGKRILLHVQLLSTLCSPPLTPMAQLLQSSCSFPFSSINNDQKLSSLSTIHNSELSCSDYYSHSDASASGITSSNSQFSLPSFSNKQSHSDSGHLSSIEDLHDLSVSFNNISKSNPLPTVACKDHNRGRRYLIDLAMRANVPILPTIEAAIQQAISWSQRPTVDHGWAKKSIS